jgi:small basic protein
MTRVLLQKSFDKKIFLATTLANVISGLVGLAISIALNGGG